MQPVPSSRVVALCLALPLAVAAAVAGPINPPAGPVAPTHKTLSAVEPRTPISLETTPGDANSLYRITQPGSYYLTGSITGETGKHGIEIAASGVTIDLNGFDLLGVPGSLDGITASGGSLSSAAVHGGIIRSWGDDGVDLFTTQVPNSRVTDLRVRGNVNFGISISAGSEVSRCVVALNGIFGIRGGGSGATILDCTAHDNVSTGISVGSGTTISRCTAYTNGADGFTALSTCSITGCVAYQNGDGGIDVGTNCIIAGCTASGNSGYGLDCTSACIVRDNVSTSNGNGFAAGANIHAGQSDNRIEGNVCVGAPRGIDVAGAGNVILRNTCSGAAANWVIAANNVHGPILDRTAPGSAAVNGNSAPSSLGSTDANANYSY